MLKKLVFWTTFIGVLCILFGLFFLIEAIRWFLVIRITAFALGIIMSACFILLGIWLLLEVRRLIRFDRKYKRLD